MFIDQLHLKHTFRLLQFLETAFLFAGMFLYSCIPVNAYIDPSIMTYTVQAVAGLLIASATFLGIGWRKLRRRFLSESAIAAKRYKNVETDDLVFTDPKDPEKAQTPENADIHTSAVWLKNAAVRQSDTSSRSNLRPVMTWKQRLMLVLIPSVFTVFTMLVYIPSSIYIGNSGEFKITYSQAFPLLAVFALLVLAVLCLFGLMLNDFTCRFYAAGIFAVGFAVYLQTNFLNPSLPAFNGFQLDWSAYASSTRLSTVMWIAVLCLSVILAYSRKKVIASARKLICLLLTAVQAVSLLYTLLTVKQVTPETYPYYFTRNNEFEISSTENTIVIVLDTLDSTWFEDIFINQDLYTEELKDFTYYIDALAGAAPTCLGIPYILSGVDYQLGWDRFEYQKHAMEEGTMLKDFKDNGIVSRIYTDHMDFLQYTDMTLVENTAPNHTVYQMEDKKLYLKQMLKIAAFFEAPMLLKKNIRILENPLNALTIDVGNEDPAYVIDDPQFYIDFKTEHFNPTYTEPVFTVYHLFGAHPPFYMNENAERIPVATETADHIRQMMGCFKICTEMLDELKQCGVYDSSTIIITADHGGIQYFQNPAILVKLPEETHDAIVTSTAPVTFENLHNTIAASLLEDHSSYGKCLNEVEEDQVLTRKHIVYNVAVTRIAFPDDPVFKNYNMTEVTFYGGARDIENLSYSEDTSCDPQ